MLRGGGMGVAGCGPAKGRGKRDSRRVHPKHPEIVKRVDRGGGESVRKLAGGGA